MLRSYKYRLYPNKKQDNLLAKHFGACRWVYNDALSFRLSLWQKEQKSISWLKLSARLPLLKLHEETSWLREIDSSALIGSIVNLEKAYQGFFKHGRNLPSKLRSKRGRQSYQCGQWWNINQETQIDKITKIFPHAFCMFTSIQGVC